MLSLLIFKCNEKNSQKTSIMSKNKHIILQNNTLIETLKKNKMNSFFIKIINLFQTNGDNNQEPSTGSFMMKDNVILLIDNDPDQIYTMKTIIEDQTEYTVIPAQSVEECIKILDQGIEPKVIISETLMPGTDGLHLYQYLHNHSSWKDIPFVFLTAWNINWEEHKDIANNTLILNKPINFNDFQNKILRTIMIQ